jgi:hypothetical protein
MGEARLTDPSPAHLPVACSSRWPSRERAQRRSSHPVRRFANRPLVECARESLFRAIFEARFPGGGCRRGSNGRGSGYDSRLIQPDDDESPGLPGAHLLPRFRRPSLVAGAVSGLTTYVPGDTSLMSRDMGLTWCGGRRGGRARRARPERRSPACRLGGGFESRACPVLALLSSRSFLTSCPSRLLLPSTGSPADTCIASLRVIG